MFQARWIVAFVIMCTLTVQYTIADDKIPTLEQCNVVWDSPSVDSAGSMPLGNGDIGLNVWVEADGDLQFYISKTDAWGDDNRGSYGMPKVGRVRIKVPSNPLKAGVSFKQTLQLRQGQIVINEGPLQYTVWVDANNPVIHVEVQSDQGIGVQASLVPYRTKPAHGLGVDQIIPNQKDRVAWCYHNGSKEAPQLVDLTFGAVMKGPGLLPAGDNITLQFPPDAPPPKTQRIDIYPFTAQAPTADAWLAQLDPLIAKIDAIDLAAARKAHQDWWAQFWDRSWIFVSGNDAAQSVTEGYALQRFVQGCSGRGAYPMKFNGGIFTTDMTYRHDNKDFTVDADYRDWGGQYWFQNTRAMFWPLLQSGDFDMMLPLFRMYKNEIAYNAPLVKKYYGHDGSYMAETAPFWGGIPKIKPEDPGLWTNRYYTPVLEMTMMMLDYYEYTGDKAFVRDTLVPIASSGLTFYDQHWGRDAKGKILLDPDNSIEMYWKIHNPLPDIAGLHAVLPRLLALPDDLVDAQTRQNWQKMVGELPDIPLGIRNGKQAILPMEDGQDEKASHNGENPELYAIYPFRLYGLEKPDLDLARYTFSIRRCRQKGCWVQDPIQAAMLGLANVAQSYVTFNFNCKDPHMRFPAFWTHANDYMPDEDNGGNGLNGLQQMLVQSVDHHILLLPAWPKDWNASFKLHAAFQTTVEATVRDGKIEGLKVTPADRQKDVEILGDAAK